MSKVQSFLEFVMDNYQYGDTFTLKSIKDDMGYSGRIDHPIRSLMKIKCIDRVKEGTYEVLISDDITSGIDKVYNLLDGKKGCFAFSTSYLIHALRISRGELTTILGIMSMLGYIKKIGYGRWQRQPDMFNSATIEPKTDITLSVIANLIGKSPSLSITKKQAEGIIGEVKKCKDVVRIIN